MSRRTRCGAAVLLAAATVLAQLAGPVAWRLLSPAAAGQTTSVTAADRDFLVRVRLAGLWEMPAGDLAVQKGSTARVREVGAIITQQHVELDRLVVRAAKELDVPLPDEPSAEQAYWLREMEAASGPAFDKIFAQRLREAHGKIFPAIAEVRAKTRNPVVRKLADEANGFVKNHLSLLDSTGDVDHQVMPPLNEPAAEEDRFVLLGDPRHPDPGPAEPVAQAVVALTGGLAALLALVLGMRVLFPSRGFRVVRPPEPAPLPHRRP